MEKLKTLKDLTPINYPVCGPMTYDEGKRDGANILAYNLKIEAIKWIKEEILIRLKICEEPISEENITWALEDEDLQRWMNRFDINKKDII